MYSIEVGNFDDRCWLSDLIMSVFTQNYLQSLCLQRKLKLDVNK